MRPPFISLEGMDGAGKSSHTDTLLDALNAAGWDVVQTKEPGGTPLGDRLRMELKETEMDLATEVFIAFASRCEHLAQVIRPALAAGQAVLTDRFTDSTFAYQGAANGYPIEKLNQIEQIVHGDLQPDLTLFFDVTPEVAETRRQKRLAQDTTNTVSATDKFDNREAEWFAKTRQGYLDRIAAHPDRYVVIDGAQPIEQVAAQVRQVMEQFVQRYRQDTDQPRPGVGRRRGP